MPAPTNPVKASEIRDGFKRSETFFLAHNINPARARELAARCVSNYRATAGANRIARRGNGQTMKGLMLRRSPAEAFAPATLAAIIKGEGVL